MENLKAQYLKIRKRTEAICSPLQTEDYVVQPIADVSPPKWHLGHTTWFFETFILKPNVPGYEDFNAQYNFVFNSYYETVGARVIRTDRGNLSRPSVGDIYRYRSYVDAHMEAFFGSGEAEKITDLLLLGLNHEQQHQELLLTDIKYILGHNPLFPVYQVEKQSVGAEKNLEFYRLGEGIYEMGFDGPGFSFDNEMGRHKVWLDQFEIAASLVSNAEYLEFIRHGGYADFNYWHAEGWDWVKTSQAMAPLYWHFIEGEWMQYTLEGLVPLDPHAPVCHVNFYEASAYASWKGMRLPTEFEWEAAAGRLDWGKRWEWTNSAYLPYPGFSKAPGAIGEYNGKFMVNQMVLRGASEATPEGHSRKTYRNFFQARHQWQFTGIRLVK